MRRPIVFIAMAFTLGIAGQHVVKLNINILTGLLLVELILFLICITRKDNKRLYYIFFIAAMVIAGAIWLSIEELKTSVISVSNEQVIIGAGTVKTAVKKDENYYKLVVDVDIADKSKVGENTIINYYGDLEKDYSLYDCVGREINFRGMVSIPEKNRNPKTFNYRQHLKTVGIFTLIECNPGDIIIRNQIKKTLNEILNYLSIIKGKITNNLILTIGEKRCGLISGMMWGEKNNIEEDVMEQFRMNGTAHILAVSGIHVGLVYLYLNKLILGRKYLFFDAIVIMLLLCYAAMAAFSPSVVRAVMMIIIHVISKHTYCRYDMLSCGAATILSMLLLNPMSLFNIGFQLSFLAIFSLAGLLPFLQKIHNSFITPIVALQFGLSPMTAYVFNYFSLGSIVANIPIIFIASLIIPLGLLTIPIMIFGLPLFYFNLVAVPMGYLIDLMLAINDMIYAPGKSFFYIISPGIVFMIIYYFALFFLTSELFFIMFARKKYSQIKKILFVVIMLTGFVNLILFDEFTRAEIIFVDVGQGDCLHIKTKDGKNILIDGGGNLHYDVGEKVLMPYLLKNGVGKIEAAFVTHLHKDHYGGIATLAKKGMIKKLYIYEANEIDEKMILEETGLDKEQIEYLGKGDKILLDEEISVKVLSPQRKSEEEYRKLKIKEADENEKCLVLKLNYKGISVLMTGDIDCDGEKSLIKEYAGSKELKATLLKVSHHGSKYGTSDEFLEEVNPDLAVIQVGKNNFGHPNPGVIEKIKKKGIKVYRNDMTGALGISIENNDRDGEKMKIFTVNK